MDQVLNQTLDQAFKDFLRDGTGIARLAHWVPERRQLLESDIRGNLQRLGVPFSSINLSCSHTIYGPAPTIFIAGSNRRIGVDLEFKSRVVHAGVLERISSAEERELLKAWNVLRFWVVKEAAYKSYPKNLGTTVSQYRIEAWNPISQEGSIQFPGATELRCRFKQFELGEWSIAIAESY